MKRNNKRRDLTALGLSIVVLVLLNYVGSFMFHRFDLTTEKRFTLAPETKTLLKKLNDVVYVKVYLEGDFPAGFKMLRTETKEMLDEFRTYSGDNIEYEFINPSSNPDKKQREEIYKQLYKKGLRPRPIQDSQEDKKTEQLIWPGALVTYKGHEIAWNLLKTQIGKSSESQLNTSIQSLEYEFASCIHNLGLITRPEVAFIQGHGELDTLQVKDITKALEDFYIVKRITLREQINALDGISAIIIAKPDSAYSEKDKLILDQFIMRGGKVLWAIDPLLTSVDSLKKNGETMSIARDLNIDNMLFKYGVRINQNMVIDMKCSSLPINQAMRGEPPNIVLMPWVFNTLATPVNNHPLTKNLDVIKLEFTSGIDTISASGITKTILAKSSHDSKTLASPVRISLDFLHHDLNPKAFINPDQTVAVLLEGKFKSVFANRVFLSNPQQDEEFKKQLNFKSEGVANKMIVISDGDVLKNDIQPSSGKTYPLGFDKYSNQMFGNRNFILNCMNYLCDDSGLISVRNRELTLRLLDKKKVESEKMKWQLINTFVPLLLIIAFGVIQNFKRKRKYAK